MKINTNEKTVIIIINKKKYRGLISKSKIVKLDEKISIIIVNTKIVNTPLIAIFTCLLLPFKKIGKIIEYTIIFANVKRNTNSHNNIFIT